MISKNGQKIFSISRGEKVLLVAVFVNLIILSSFILSSSKSSTELSKTFSSAHSTSKAIIFTERETLAFAVKYSEWLGGQIPKRDVQIAKALLAQRLSVVNEDGTSTGERVYPTFLNLLAESDSILGQAPDGILQEESRQELGENAYRLVDEIVFVSRQMTFSYQQELDAQVLDLSQFNKKNTFNNLLSLISFIVLTTVLLIWGISTFRIQYRLAKKTLNDEEIALLATEDSLRKAESTVKTLEEMDISKSDFISTVNHELRTPLTSIIGYIDVLKTLDLEKDLGQLPQITTVIDRNSEVLLDIIESILSLSSLDSPDQIPRFEKVQLIEIIERKIFVLTPLINEKSLVVTFHHDFIDDFVVLGNAGQLSQVVLNLLSNAIKFSPKNSAIDLYLSVESDKDSKDVIQLEIKDHGIGIPKDEIPSLFTRFFRASNAVSSQIVGTGLGLAIVARILDLHQASVRVESEVNKGSSFIVTFPPYESETQLLVSKNRSGVLYKAIVALKASGPDELIDICHQMSSTVGFYDLEKEMHLISDLQLWLESNPGALSDLVYSKKEELISALENSYAGLDNGMERK